MFVTNSAGRTCRRIEQGENYDKEISEKYCCGWLKVVNTT